MKGTQPSSRIRPAEFLQRHNVFLRRARDASHQALFFLGLLEGTTNNRINRAISGYRPFALYQVRALVRGVHLPEAYSQVKQDLDSGALRPMERQKGELERAIRLFCQWRVIFDELEDLQSADPLALRQSFVIFLHDSREERLRQRLESHWFPDLFAYLKKNLSLLWASALVLALVLEIEAVNSLLNNEGTTLLLPLALLLVPLSVPWALASLSRWRRGTAPVWDIAGTAFRSFRCQAVEPGRLIHHWPLEDKCLPKEIFKGQLAFLCVQIAWLAVGFLVLHLFYWLGAVSGSTVTAFLVLSHLCVLLILARALDFWDYLDPRPIRFILLFAAVILLLALFVGIERELIMVASLAAAVAYLLLSRQRGMFRWVIVLCLLIAVGVNFIGKKTLEREVWRDRSQMWKRLGPGDWPWPTVAGSREPVVILAASGGGSRAAVYTGLTLYHLQRDRPEIAEHLQAISSVSGGSLASAAYIARLMETPNDPDEAARRSGRSVALGDLKAALQEDFLFPTLRGALCPGRTRASSIEKEWRTGPVGLSQYHLSDLVRRWRHQRRLGAPIPPFPIPLFNSSTLDGHNVVISPLGRELYSSGLDGEASDPQRNAYHELGDGPDLPTWVYYRDGIYGLEDLLPHFDPKLSAAVRASANFPFGFPLVRVATTQPLFFSPLASERSPGPEKQVRLTDGGALNNSGMWSLFHLLIHPDTLPALQERGVLLILVEASWMPRYRRLDKAFNSLLGTLEDRRPIGQRLHREMFELLERAYGDRIAIVQIDLVPRESFNVLTTWALDQRSLRQLEGSFKERWKEELENITQSWAKLKARSVVQDPCWPPVPASYIAWRRPPLD